MRLIVSTQSNLLAIGFVMGTECERVCKATMAHLFYMKKVMKPKIAISENVCTGTIGFRIASTLVDDMSSKARTT